MNDETPSRGGHSVTRLLRRLKTRDEEAAAEIWRKYFERLIPLARAKLKNIPGRSADEEDVLVSVFDRFFKAVKGDRFAQLEDRDDLWQILLMLTERRVKDQYRRDSTQKRGAGQITGENALSDVNFGEIREIADAELSPEFVVTFNDFLSHAIVRLKDERIREVALLRMEGYSNSDIALRMDVSESTIERKLRLVRSLWAEELADDS